MEPSTNGELQSSSSKSIRIFISHSSLDKNVAGTIKQILETYFGFEVFVAHDDIEPTAVWTDRILEELVSTDVVLALLTENFKNSNFTDQECGYALALKKYIIPVKISINPYGFIGKFQALPFKILSNHTESWITFCRKIVETINTHELFAGKVTDLLIKALKNSYSFDTTIKIIKLLREISPFTEIQANDILKAYFTNNQISSEGYHVPYFMNNLIKLYKDKLDKNLLLRYEAE